MKVLMITGDKRFGPGNERYELQKSAVDELAVVYAGRGTWNPSVPKGSLDVVTSQDPFWRGLIALRLARRLNIRLNIQVHADISGQSFIKKLIAARVLRQADSIRVVSDKIKEQVLRIAPRAKVAVLPVYLDVLKFAQLPRVPHAGKVILWVGRFEGEKQPLGALQVLKEVLPRVPDAKLVMLGSGSLENDLKKQGAGLPVEFAGWKDAADFLPSADVVLCTSLHESWGVSIVEALAANVPVVAPDVGVAREAGASVVSRDQLAQTVIKTLQSGARGEFKLKLLSKDEWVRAWKESLI